MIIGERLKYGAKFSFSPGSGQRVLISFPVLESVM